MNQNTDRCNTLADHKRTYSITHLCFPPSLDSDEFVLDWLILFPSPFKTKGFGALGPLLALLSCLPWLAPLTCLPWLALLICLPCPALELPELLFELNLCS